MKQEPPHISGHLPGPELAVAMNNAANILEVEGRRALSGCVFGVGNRLRMTAAALQRCVELLLDPPLDMPPLSSPEIAAARESLAALAAFMPWHDRTLHAYSLALGRFLDRDARAASPWPRTTPCHHPER